MPAIPESGIIFPGHASVRELPINYRLQDASVFSDRLQHRSPDIRLQTNRKSAVNYYFNLANACGHKYAYLMGEPTAESNNADLFCLVAELDGLLSAMTGEA